MQFYLARLYGFPVYFLTRARIARHRLSKYMKIFSHSHPDERLELFKICLLALPQGARALEIGSHVGSSACFMAAGLSRIGGSLICVDTWNNDAMNEETKDNFSIFKSNTADFANLITTIRKRSSDLEVGDYGSELDFVFIDADHSEEAVRNDFQIVERAIRVGGLLAFHDAGDVYPGITIVAGEALASGRWRMHSLVRTLLVLRRVQ